MDYEIYINEEIIRSQLIKPNKNEMDFTLCILNRSSPNISLSSLGSKIFIIGNEYCKKEKIFKHMIYIGNFREIKCIRGQSQI